jgi:hypothetical protein
MRNLLLSPTLTKIGISNGLHKDGKPMQVLTFAKTYATFDEFVNPVVVELPGYPWTKDELSVSYLGSACTIDTFTDDGAGKLDLTCNLPEDVTGAVLTVAGDWLPLVHFKGLGYALTTGLSMLTVPPIIDITVPISGS